MRLLFYYIRWHYGKGIVDYINIVGNFVWFFYNFFSIPLMAKTLFAPFRRLGDSYKGTGLDIGAFFSVVIVNTLMRFVGALFRTLLILVGLVFILGTVIVGSIFFIVWIMAPLFLLFLVLYGVKLISVS